MLDKKMIEKTAKGALNLNNKLSLLIVRYYFIGD
jgi:hypothetical protein